MEASALRHASQIGLAARSPLLRLQSDEKLILLIREGHEAAFEAIFQRYQARLLAFCRHMLGSKEDAEDILQEVFAAAYNAILADQRAINARPWLYRIARNRCLNHLRRPVATGQDSMDIHPIDNGLSTAERVQKREDLRDLIADVGTLPETQRTALLLREIDALSYEEIAQSMGTTIPSVKSLLVRARISLGEGAEARLLSCEDVRLDLGEAAEGLKKLSGAARRHVRGCEPCRQLRDQLRANNRAMAAVFPVGLLLMLKKLALAKVGLAVGAGGAAGGGGAASGGAACGGGAAAALSSAIGGAAAAGGGAAAGGAGTVASLGLGAIGTKAAAGVATAALLTAGAVEVKHVTQQPRPGPALVRVAAPPTGGVAAPVPAPSRGAAGGGAAPAERPAEAKTAAGETAKPPATLTEAGKTAPEPAEQPAEAAQPPAVPAAAVPPAAGGAQPPAPPAAPDSSGGKVPAAAQPAPPPAGGLPGESPDGTQPPQPAPAAGESNPARDTTPTPVSGGDTAEEGSPPPAESTPSESNPY